MGQVGAVIKYGKFSLIRKHHCINAQIISFLFTSNLDIMDTNSFVHLKCSKIKSIKYIKKTLKKIFSRNI